MECERGERVPVTAKNEQSRDEGAEAETWGADGGGPLWLPAGVSAVTGHGDSHAVRRRANPFAQLPGLQTPPR